MDIAGARTTAARVASALRLRRAHTGVAMRHLIRDLSAAVRSADHAPAGVREVCHALCARMSARRGGRPVELRFERFPDEIEVTGLWVEFQDFDLVIVEERAESIQQLVILGHELWHLHAGHRHHHHGVGTAAAHAFAGRPGWDDVALTVAARDGSRQTDEAEADDFGHRLAAAVRTLVPGEEEGASPDPVHRSLGYRGRGGRTR
ncbi:toxin-antitoxin system, toxin component family protein [Streptomyces sp. NPDC059852]|uniref:toxin-antitoxin system, toxin component family protein n=1 Tax=Streptomyces sp. NPDC059852 TaxID=3346972 RepID=UPI00365F42C7